MFRVKSKTLYCAECVATDPLEVIDNDEDVTVEDPNRHFDTPWYCSGCGAIVAGSLPLSEEEEAKSYRLVLRDESGTEYHEEFENRPSEIEITEAAVEAADEELVLPEGGNVELVWTLFLGEDEIDSDSVIVTVPPDHETLIRKAVTGPHCGYLPKDHDWSSEGEGGCDQNPGVWSVGGTGLVVREHCEACRLRREWYYPGTQALPGEHDSVTYSYE